MKRDDSQLTHDCNLILQLSNIPSGKIADFCCGSGQMIKYFNNLKYDCYGVDFSKEYVDIAVNQFNLNNVFQGDALYFNFNSSFDLVINWNSSFGYFNEEKNELLLKNMYNQLNKNGKIILEIFNSYYILLNFKRHIQYHFETHVIDRFSTIDIINKQLIQRWFFSNGKEYVTYNKLYLLNDIVTLLEKTGFKNVKYFEKPNHNLVFKLPNENSQRIIFIAEKQI